MNFNPSAWAIACTLASPKPASPRNELDPNMCGHTFHRLTQKLRRPIGARAVTAPQPVVGDEFAFSQGGDQRPMTRLESLPGVTNGHALLMAILMQQRPRIQVQRVTFFAAKADCPAARRCRPFKALQVFCPNTSKNRLKVDWLAIASTPSTSTQRRITLQPSHAGELVRAAENAPDISQCHIGRIISVGAGRTVGQDFPQLPAKSLLMQKVRPYDHAAMGGQTLIGE